MAPMNDRKGAGMNRAFSAGTFAHTASWGAAPGCYDAAPSALNTPRFSRVRNASASVRNRFSDFFHCAKETAKAVCRLAMPQAPR